MPRHAAAPLLAVACLASLAASSPSHGVVGQWNRPMCGGNDWERIKTPQAEYAVIDSAGACVSGERFHPAFAVASVERDIAWQYPAIVAGYTPEGEPACASPRDTCFALPVQAGHDGAPEESFGSWISGGYEGNESDDIWFSPVKSRHSIAEKAGDTELMIWTDWSGGNGGHRFAAYATIDHKRWGIMSWTAGGPHRYVAYLWLNANSSGRGHQVNVSGLWLNPFFRNAESHGWLRPDEWLWSVDMGFEMNRGGTRNNVHAFSLTGLPGSGPKP
jgi:hypothetical protein